MSIHTECQEAQRVWDQLLVRHCDRVFVSCVEVLGVRQDNIQVSSCLPLLSASPTTYRSSSSVRNRKYRSFSAFSCRPIYCSILFSNSRLVSKNNLCMSFESGLQMRTSLSAFGIDRHNFPPIGMTDGPSFGGAAFHWNCCSLNDDLFSFGHLVVVLS